MLDAASDLTNSSPGRIAPPRPGPSTGSARHSTSLAFTHGFSTFTLKRRASSRYVRAS